MTLIARVSIRNAPVLIGDVLLSSERRSGVRANLPLVGDINRILASQGLYFEVSFVQKVNILSDRLAVAWSGQELQAKRALRALADVSSREKLCLTDIETELRAIDPDKIDKLQLIGILAREVRGAEVAGSKFAFQVQPIDVPGLGSVHAAGTGAHDFIQMLGETDWTLGGVANERQVAHALVGDLVNIEYRRGGTIEKRWGGGFEAVTFTSDSGRFEKVGDVLHTFWKVDLSSPGKAEFIPWFYKTTYWRDALIVRYARINSVGERKFQLAMNSFELIPPLLKHRQEYALEELGSVDFSHKVLQCHVSVERPGGRDILQLIEPSKPGSTLQLEFRESGAVHLEIPGELNTKIIEEAQTRASASSSKRR